jgi:predicted dehydrogenase
MLRPAVIGGGTMGALHVRGLLSRDDVDSLVLVDPDTDRAQLLSRRHGRLRGYASVAEALANEALDFAVVAVPIGAAPDTIAVLLEHGVAVLAEKPLAATAATAEELAHLAARHQTLLSVGYIERFNPAVEALHDELARTGCTVYNVHARRLSPFPHRAGMAGVAIDVATHDLDVLRFVIGATPIRVYAETDIRRQGGGEDLLCASLRFDNGVTGLVESNWLTPTKVRRLTVTTEVGMYDIDYLTQDLWLFEHASGDAEWEALGVMRGANEGRTVRFALERREPLAIEHDRFVDALRSGGPAPVSAWEAVDTLVVAEAILESSRTNQPSTPRVRTRR